MGQQEAKGTWLSEEEARDRLVRKIAELGSQAAVARAANVSPARIGYALGGRQAIGKQIGEALGLIAVSEVAYRYLVKD